MRASTMAGLSSILFAEVEVPKLDGVSPRIARRYTMLNVEVAFKGRSINLRPKDRNQEAA